MRHCGSPRGRGQGSWALPGSPSPAPGASLRCATPPRVGLREASRRSGPRTRSDRAAPVWERPLCGAVPALEPPGRSTQKCWPWITSVNTGEPLGARPLLPRYTAVIKWVPLPRPASAGTVTENWPSATWLLPMDRLPLGPASNMTTVPEAFGDTTPENVSGVSGLSKALAGSWVADGEVNRVWVGCIFTVSAKVGTTLAPSTPPARTTAASAARVP